MRRFKLSLSSSWTSSNFTDGGVSITLSPILKVSFVSSFFLFIAYNRLKLNPHWQSFFFVSNQLMSILLSDSKTNINVQIFWAIVVNVLSSAKLCMVRHNQFGEKRKHSTLKKLFPSVTSRRKYFLGKTHWIDPFLMSCFFTEIFVHLPVFQKYVTSAFRNW